MVSVILHIEIYMCLRQNCYGMIAEKTTLVAFLVALERRMCNFRSVAKTRWNKTAAAKLLGITFRQLRYRLQKLELE